MTFDLLSAIAMTAGAAFTIAVVARAMTATRERLLPLVAALATWFAAVVALGASGALHDAGALGLPGLGVAVTLPILVMAILTFGTAAGRRALAEAPVPALIGVNLVRLLGVTVVLLDAAGRLPAPFAPAAGWGDIAVGATAPLVAWMVARDRPGSRRIALAWNALGTLDLVDAIALGVTSSPGPIQLFSGDPSTGIMTLLPWFLIPGFMVPLLLYTHVALFARLAKASRLKRTGIIERPVAVRVGGT